MIIQSVGIELEGGLDDPELSEIRKTIPQMTIKQTFNYWDDGSVNVKGKDNHNIELVYWSNKISDVLTFAKLVYANGFKTNHTCGLHVHVRLRDDVETQYNYFHTHKIFMDAYKKRFCKIKKYERRLTNRYCRTTYNQEHIGSDRYVAVNAQSLYEEHKTLEIRLLPAQRSFREFEQSLVWTLKTIKKAFNKSKKNMHTQKIVLIQKEIFIEQDKIETQFFIKKFEINKKIKRGMKK